MAIKLKVPARESVKAGINVKSKARRQRLKDEAGFQTLAAHTGRNDISPRLIVEEVPIHDRRPAGRRIRKSAAAHVAEACRSISAFGFCVPLLIDGGRRIIDGHIRWEAAQRLDMESAPCIIIDHLSEEQIRLLRIGLNRMAENGEWDPEVLRLELIDLGSLNLDLRLTGFTDIELDIILQDPAVAEHHDNEQPDVEDIAITIPGDLWQLGAHKLLCGDATKRGSYEQLMSGERAHMSFGDPPCNIPIAGFVSGLGKKKHSNFAMGCGEMSGDEFRALLASYLTLSREFSKAGAVIFACMDWRHSHDIALAADSVKLNHIQTCVWDKGSGAMGSLYRNAYELVHVFCTAPKPARNNIELGRHGRDRTNVQHYPGANRRGSSAGEALKLHATPKPVELIEDYMIDVSAKGDIVLDPFIGSGTTIIAAERCERRAYGIELDPKFVDVAIRRWQEWAGKQAIHIESGLTFDQLAAERSHSPPVEPEID